MIMRIRKITLFSVMGGVLPESQLHFREMHLQCGQWFGNAADRRGSDAGISGSDVGSRL